MPAPILLPPSFQNSFWSQDDFRTGMEVLFGKLEQGCLENQEVITFIKAQAAAHHSLAESLSTSRSYPTFSSSLSTGLSASLAQSFAHLQTLSQRQASQHASIADDLERRVLEGFIRWANVHEMRTRMASQEVLGYVPKPFEERGGGKNKGEGSLVGDYGKLVLEVAKLRQTYLVKANHADDLEEEARFHTTIASPRKDTFTPEPRPSSPRLQALTSSRSSQVSSSTSPGSGLKRTGTVAERISEKLRMASVSRSAAAMESMMIKEESEPRPESSNGTGEKLLPAPPMHNDPPARPKSVNGIVTSGLTSTDPSAPLLLAGLSLPLPGLVAILTDFARHLSLTLPPTPIGDKGKAKGDEGELRSRTRTTIFGTFDESFSGAELVDWLLSKLEGFAGQMDRAEEAGSELLRWGLIGRIGVGRGWEAGDETFYVLKDSATEDSPFAIEALRNHIHALIATVRGVSGPAASDNAPPSPSKGASPSVPTLATASSMLQNYLPQALKNASMNGEAGHVKARREAKAADEEYREALGELEDMRLGIEARLESGMGQWEGWERERLKAVKTVLSQYEMVVAQIPKRLHEVSTGVKVAVEAYKPEADLLALIEGSRTGNFRPKAHIYDSLDSDDYDVTFGIDLRKWGGQQGWKAIMRKEASEGSPRESIPHVLTALLQGLEEKYNGVSDDVRRKSWLYLVSLGEVHPLRELINDPHVPTQEMIKEVKKFNPPVIAATIKLWLLELSPPILGYDCYESMKNFYKKGDERNPSTEDAPQPLVDMLAKLSSTQILVLDAILAHFNALITNTKTEESDGAYITKLSLSVGRHFLRPQVETVHTLQDHTPSRLFGELLRKRDQLLPSLVERARKTLDRPMPQRKATRPVDQRISRSKLSVSGEDGREILRGQVPRTPSRSSIPSVHGREGSSLGSHEEEVQTPQDPVITQEVRRTIAVQEDFQAAALASPIATSMVDDQKSSFAPTAEPESLPAEPFKQATASPTDVQATPAHEVASETQAARVGPEVETDAADVVLSLDGERNGFAGSGARLSRKRPVSKDLDQPIQEGDSTLRRTGSGETSKVRGPRLATRGPRPVPSKIVAELSSPTSPRPSSPSIRDRIANLENKANSGGDRFV